MFSRSPFVRLGAALVFMLAAGACRGSDAPETEPADVSAPAADTAPDVVPTPMGLISSGTVEVPPQVDVPVAPTQPGQSRIGTIAEARSAVPFTLLVPTEFPGTAFLELLHIITPYEGQAGGPDLPAVRMIYGMDEGGTIVVYQSPATGAPADGEPVTIGSYSGTVRTEDSAQIVTWEQDGVRIELRGLGLELDALTAVGASLAVDG